MVALAAGGDECRWMPRGRDVSPNVAEEVISVEASGLRRLLSPDASSHLAVRLPSTPLHLDVSQWNRANRNPV